MLIRPSARGLLDLAPGARPRDARRPATRTHLLQRAMIGAVLSAGCAMTGSGNPPVTASVNLLTLAHNGEEEITRDGITISVTPVTMENILATHDAIRAMDWSESPAEGSGPSRSRRPERHASIPLVPIPAFRVVIGNHTGHVIRFTQTVFRLENNFQQTYPLFANASELLAWEENFLAATEPTLANDRSAMAQLRGAIGTVPLLNRNTELLDGDVFTGFLVFNVNPSGLQSDYVALLTSVGRFRLRMAEVPVELDSAGQPSRTTTFEFAFDRSQVTRDVVCPPGTQTFSIATCSMRPAVGVQHTPAARRVTTPVPVPPPATPAAPAAPAPGTPPVAAPAEPPTAPLPPPLIPVTSVYPATAESAPAEPPRGHRRSRHRD